MGGVGPLAAWSFGGIEVAVELGLSLVASLVSDDVADTGVGIVD